VVRQLGLHDLLLDQLIEGMEIGRLVALGVILSLCKVVPESCDLGLEQLAKQPQLFLFPDNVLAIESHPLSLTIKS